MSSIRLTSSPPLASLSDPSSGKQAVYSFNSKVMVAAMVMLFIVVVFVVSLHIYAKWFWQHGTAASRWSTARALNASWHRRQLQRRVEVVADADTVVASASSTGLHPSAVDSLPTFIYDKAAHEAEPLLECAVCLSEFQVHDKGRILPLCKHSFHIDCIDMWFRSHSTCPLCRSPVSPPIMAHRHLAGNTPNPPPPSLQHSASSAATDQLDDHSDGASAAQWVCPPLSLLHNADHHEPLPLLQSTSGLELHPQHEEGLADMAPMSGAHIPSASTSCLHNPAHGGFLSRDDITYLSLLHMGASVSSSIRSTATDLLQQQGRETIVRSTSLSLSRHLSDDMQGSSPQPQKSSSFRMSIKRLLSREVSKGRSRVFPSGERGAELEQNASNMSLPV